MYREAIVESFQACECFKNCCFKRLLKQLNTKKRKPEEKKEEGNETPIKWKRDYRYEAHITCMYGWREKKTL